jgi:RNA polymerase sigma-70 factor (ECF subfamily)
VAELEDLMLRYQQADAVAISALIGQVSPLLLRFFRSQCGSRAEAEDLLQDTWLQIHKVRHTYRSGEPLLPWIYAIARHVKVDSYRRSQRIRSREQIMSPLPELSASVKGSSAELPDFDTLIAILPPSQRDVVSMLKVGDMSLAEVARATSSSVGAVKAEGSPCIRETPSGATESRIKARTFERSAICRRHSAGDPLSQS